MKRILLLLTLFLMSFTTLLQAQTATYKGKIVSADDNLPLPNATVKMTWQRDSTYFKYASTNLQGEFNFDNIRKGRYRFEITYVGFEKYENQVQLTADLDAGTIAMKPSATMLQGVDVKTQAIRGEQKGDTVQFNSDAFKVAQDATTEDLVKKMPGVTVENGTVKAQGEEVKKILVDGKQFFGDDPNVALKNLPAEVVDKIQIFDKMSDQAAWTGFDDGSGQKTLNIVTKNNRNTGQFGKFAVGYGTDDRFMAGVNMNFFDKTRRITLLAMGNNINQQNFSAEDLLGSSSGSSSSGSGMGRRMSGGFNMGPAAGINTLGNFGMNFTQSWDPKITLNASYFYNTSRNKSNSIINRQYFLSDTSSKYYLETNDAIKDNSNHRFNARLEYNINDKNSIIVSPRFSYQNMAANSTMNALTWMAEGDTLSSASDKPNSDGNAYNFSNELLYRHKLKKVGRTFSISVTTGSNNRDNIAYQNALTKYQESTNNDTLKNKVSSMADGLNLSSNLVYTEPLGAHSQLQFSYNLAWSKNDNDRRQYDYNEVKTTYDTLNILYSSVYNTYYTTHRPQLGYLYQDDKLNINAGLSYQFSTLEGVSAFPMSDTVKGSYGNILPNFWMNYKITPNINWRANYRASTNAPAVSQLQKVADVSNSLLVTSGNPDLKEEVRHFAMSRISLSDKDKVKNLFAIVFFQRYKDYIGSSTVTLANDTTISGVTIYKGAQLTSPVNLDGNWNTRGLITYGFPVKFIKSNLNFNVGASYNHQPGLINYQKNLTQTIGLNQGVVISSNISKEFDFTLTYNFNYNFVNSTLQASSNNNYIYQVASAQINWEFWKGFFVQNNVTYQKYDGLSSSVNDEYTLWTAALGKKLFKGKAAEIKLSCFDILNQNKSISRSVTDVYIEDTDTRTLQQYFMLTFTYNLRKFNGNQVNRDDFRTPDGNRPYGPPPGGGTPPAGPPPGL